MSLAGLGPALVQVTVPLTRLPAPALDGKPLSAACMSACGFTATGWLAWLLPGTGSAVPEPAVTSTVTEPLAGALKLLLQLRLAPTARRQQARPTTRARAAWQSCARPPRTGMRRLS